MPSLFIKRRLTNEDENIHDIAQFPEALIRSIRVLSNSSKTFICYLPFCNFRSGRFFRENHRENFMNNSACNWLHCITLED